MLVNAGDRLGKNPQLVATHRARQGMSHQRRRMERVSAEVVSRILRSVPNAVQSAAQFETCGFSARGFKVSRA